jgi:carboxylesterase type B
MGHNDYEQPICFEHPDMHFTEALAFITPYVGQKWISVIVDYYHLNSCSVHRSANTSRCCNIVRLILMDMIFDCDIRRLFDAFYLKYGPEYENNKLFSYHLNCYPKCPIVLEKDICRHSSELPFVFGTVSDCDSHRRFDCTWNNQTRVFSNGIISHWINIATRRRPLSEWANYDPSTPKYFHITPDQGFLSEPWNRNCSFFEEMEAEGVRETFGNNNYVIKGTFK